LRGADQRAHAGVDRNLTAKAVRKHVDSIALIDQQLASLHSLSIVYALPRQVRAGQIRQRPRLDKNIAGGAR